MREPHIGRRWLHTRDSIQNPQGRGVTGRAGGNSHCQAISTAEGQDALLEADTATPTVNAKMVRPIIRLRPIPAPFLCLCSRAPSSLY